MIRNVSEWLVGVWRVTNLPPRKESLHNKPPLGDRFRILGVTFDPKLTMDICCHEVAAIAHNQLNIILRTRQYHDQAALVRLYKSYVISFVEAGLPAYYHAPPFFLGAIDRVQDRFLEALNSSPEQALSQYSLAPLGCRRDIAMLGLLHRISLGTAPAAFAALSTPMVAPRLPRDLRGSTITHNRQLFDRCGGSQPPAFGRSLFGEVYCYNLLPQRIVEKRTVKEF